MKKYAVIIGLLLSASSSKAQSLKQFVKEADYAYYTIKDYANAGEFYAEALTFSPPDSVRLIFQLAECARLSRNYWTAVQNYQRVLFALTPQDICSGHYRSLYLSLGISYRQLGLYDEAITSLSQTCEESERAQALIQSCEWAINQPASDTCYTRIFHFGPPVNTPSHNEFAPVIYGDTILYTAMRFNPKSGSSHHASLVGDVMYTYTYARQFTNPYHRDMRLGKRDSTISYVAFNRDHTQAYFTVCHQTSPGDLRCRIVSRNIGENSSLGPQFDVVGSAEDTFTYTHPHLAYDPVLGELLVFVSDKNDHEDVMGGTDIWYKPLDATENAASAAKPLVSVNTPANEYSPFYHTQTQTLYFSSDRLLDGQNFGGYDIYSAKKSSRDTLHFGENRVLSRPENSTKDDLFYVLSDDGKSAWFSSNRSDGYDLDPVLDACCFDLYEVQKISCPVYFEPVISSFCPDVELSEVVLMIRDSLTGDAVGSDDQGRFVLGPGRDYLLQIIHPEAQEVIDIIHVPADAICEEDVTVPEYILKPKTITLSLQLTHQCKSAVNLIEMDAEFVSVRDEVNGKILRPMMDNSIMLFDLVPRRSYSLLVDHPDYYPDDTSHHSWQFDVGANSFMFNVDLNESCTLEETLVLKHWTDTIKTIYLYFENDQPGPPNIGDTIANVHYTAAWSSYTSEENLEVYQKAFSDSAQIIATFFDEARAQKRDFDRLLTLLDTKLTEDPGLVLTLEMEGRASPLASNKYNIDLSKRRINAIKQDMIKFDLSSDSTFYNALLPRHERLRIRPRRPRGDLDSQDKMSLLGIDDSSSNLKLSVFHPAAARERHVRVKLVANVCYED